MSEPLQRVHLGRTQSNIPGLFTGHTLAFSLSEEQFEQFTRDRDALQAFVSRIDFELEPEA